MKKSIEGAVILITELANGIEVNLSCGKGFRLAAGSAESIKKIKDLFSGMQNGDAVRVDLKDGQITAIANNREQSVFKLNSIADAGAGLNETTYKKLQVKFEAFKVENGKVRMQVRNGERAEYALGGVMVAAFVQEQLKKITKGDSLRLMQSPEGHILNVVNQSKGFEFYCQ